MVTNLPRLKSKTNNFHHWARQISSPVRTFTHLRLSLTSDVEETVPAVVVVRVVVEAAAFTTVGATGMVNAVGTLSFSFSVLSSAHKRFEVLSHHKQQHKKRKGKQLNNESTFQQLKQVTIGMDFLKHKARHLSAMNQKAHPELSMEKFT